MTGFTRRDTLKIGAGALAGTTLLGYRPAFGEVMAADVPAPKFQVEKGAELRVLRPAKFVQGDETVFLQNTERFTQQTGVKVRVDNESWEDLRPKTAVAANIGSGPDVVLAWNDDPHQYPDKLIDLTEVADYLGKKYGGWYPIAERYGKGADGKWIAMPIGASGGAIVYRKSWVNQAGYETIPTDLDNFLKLAQNLKKNNHPMGFALGNAQGDGNTWTHWLIWAHGGAMVDENNKVIIDSPETIAALEYGKQLVDNFIPGTLSWLDPSNNKAFLSGEISLTSNGISVYYSAKNSTDAAIKAMAEDIYHARFPIGPVGKPTEAGLLINTMVFKHTKYPNAAKEYVRFLFEKEQYEPWQKASIGYWSHPLAAYSGNPIWTEDPKHEAYAEVMKNMLWYGYRGSLGYASAATLADFIINNMVSQVCSGRSTPKEAAAEAQRRAERYYRT